MGMDFLWFDSMKRSEEGTTKWQRGLHAALSGTGVLASSSNGTQVGAGREPSSVEQPGPCGGPDRPDKYDPDVASATYSERERESSLFVPL